MYLLNLDKPIGSATGKYCVRKYRSVWAVYDERGVWWGDFATFPEALHYATHPIERLQDWMEKH